MRAIVKGFESWDILAYENLGPCRKNELDCELVKLGSWVIEAQLLPYAREGLARRPCCVDVKVREVVRPFVEPIVEMVDAVVRAHVCLCRGVRVSSENVLERDAQSLDGVSDRIHARAIRAEGDAARSQVAFTSLALWVDPAGGGCRVESRPPP